MSGVAQRATLASIDFYRRYVSPNRPAVCRYTPSCSAYAFEAVTRFGVVRGGWLAVRRLLRCHPWHRGGHDPVPPIVAANGKPAVPTQTAMPLRSSSCSI